MQLQKGAKTKKLKHDVLSEEWGRELITRAAHHTIALPNHHRSKLWRSYRGKGAAIPPVFTPERKPRRKIAPERGQPTLAGWLCTPSGPVVKAEDILLASLGDMDITDRYDFR